MRDINITIEEINNEYKLFLERFINVFEYDDFEESFYETKEDLDKDLDIWLNQVYEEEDFHYVLENTISGFIEADKDNLVKVIDKYYRSTCDMYCYFQFEYTGYGAHLDYLYPFNPILLYLCALYFKHTNNEKFKIKSYYFCLLTICKMLDLSNKNSIYYEDENTIKLLDLFEPQLEEISKTLFADWLVINPNLTFSIGNYYLIKEDYESALKYFELGSSFDYEGRQSYEPFLAVAKNLYELGILYLKGLGVNKNIEYALEIFEKVAYESGTEYLPIMGDIYYEGIGVEKDFYQAMLCYADYMRNNESLYYFDLSETQLNRLDELLKERIANPDIEEDELRWIIDLYKNIINDWDVVYELEEKLSKEE